MDAARAIMTTDTFPKVATAPRQARRRRCDDQRHRQRRRHDRARHGDDAVLRVHRRADRRRRRLQAMLSQVGRPLVQRDHRRQRHLDLRHAADLRHRRGGRRGAPAIADAADPRARRLPARARQAAASISPSRSCATARARANSSRSASTERRRRKAAKRIALSIANSPLVKTAVAGEDANWGRVVMAVGKAGEKAERDKLDIFFGEIRVAHQGLRDPSYDEAAASAYMKKNKIVITVDLGIGTAARQGLDLRPHQGICRHQRRLSLVKLLLVVAAALVDADGRVLIAQRPKGKALEGLWEFPGGKIERRRAAGRRADPRTKRGARRHGQGGLPRAADLRQPRLRRLPSADAALRLPPLGGLRAAARRPGAEMGARRRTCATTPCRPPTRR